MLEHVIRIGLRNSGLPQQLHPSLSRRPACLVVITGDTRADHVVPGVGAMPPARNNVIQSELACLLTAVLTGESVPIEHGLPGKSAAHHGPTHHVDKADYGRRREYIRNALDVAATINYELRLAPPDQNHCASHIADVERLIILVEHQNRRIYCAHPTPSGELVCRKLPEAITVQT